MGDHDGATSESVLHASERYTDATTVDEPKKKKKESAWGGTGAMHVFIAGGLRSGAHRAGETRPTQTRHHTEHMNRISPHT